MGNVTSISRRQSSVAFEPPPSTADRLRARIRNRDRLAKQLAAEDAAIAVDARRYADERGEFLRPTIGQLRRDLQP